MRYSFLQKCILVLLVFIMLWSLLPLALFGFFGYGVLAPFLTAGVLLAVTLNFSKIKKARGKLAVLLKALSAVLGILIFFMLSIFSVCMFQKGTERYNHSATTVIVLGGGLTGDGKPSGLFLNRLEKAYEYLCQNESAVCIVSGGKAENGISEAQCGIHFLLEKGILKTRLITEEKSQNTRENFEQCAIIIAENKLSKHCAVITDGFHQLRAQKAALACGLEPAGVSTRTPPLLFVYFCSREMFALANEYILTGV
jgi:uncharacterized SAM-binding protein YcdF (DUF218 family)